MATAIKIEPVSTCRGHSGLLEEKWMQLTHMRACPWACTHKKHTPHPHAKKGMHPHYINCLGILVVGILRDLYYLGMPKICS